MNQLKAVIFDWAGTMVDFGSKAPMGAFVETFSEFGIQATTEEARLPMGLPKREHIRAMLAMPNIASQWEEEFGKAPDEGAIDEVYAIFVPRNESVAAAHSDLIPGAADVVERLRKDGLLIGSNTGYVRSIMERVLPVAAKQGYAPDNLVCADDVPVGRPTAMMMYKCFVDLGVHEPWRVVKVDDTTPGIQEGRAAGTWTVGISLSGNEVGMDTHELESQPADQVAKLNQRAAEKLRSAGAHYVVDTVADLYGALEAIEGRLAHCEKP